MGGGEWEGSKYQECTILSCQGVGIDAVLPVPVLEVLVLVLAVGGALERSRPQSTSRRGVAFVLLCWLLLVLL